MRPHDRDTYAGGQPLRYGKTAMGLRNPGFIAWGRTET